MILLNREKVVILQSVLQSLIRRFVFRNGPQVGCRQLLEPSGSASLRKLIYIASNLK